MSLILAIEPDRRQAAQLTSVIRRSVGAELVMADTTERALDAIGARVPDLILVPTLLSPQDDAALAGALHVIAAAAHVQMLTIPMLAPPAARETPRGGMLSLLRRGRTRAAAPNGCDPKVFADQISSYLQRLTDDRAASEADEIEEAGEITAGQETQQNQEIAAGVSIAAPVDVVAQEPPALIEPVLTIECADETSPVIQIEAVESSDRTEEDDASSEAEIDLTAALELETDVFEIDVDTELLGDPATALESLEAATSDPLPQQEMIDDATELIAGSRVFEADSDLWMPLSFASVLCWPALENADPERPRRRAFDQIQGVEIAAAASARVLGPTPAPVIAPPPSHHASPAMAQALEWVELVESLRHDIERLRADPAPPTTVKSDGRQKRWKPVQDEWGFFDPEQCGFTALLAKLDEVTKEDGEGFVSKPS